MVWFCELCSFPAENLKFFFAYTDTPSILCWFTAELGLHM